MQQALRERDACLLNGQSIKRQQLAWNTVVEQGWQTMHWSMEAVLAIMSKHKSLA